MALFTCPECGNQVSDKAELCPNCGYPVIEFIAQEKNKIEQQNRIMKKNKFKHKILIVVIIIAIVCIVAIGVVAINFWGNQSEREGLYDGIEWGTELSTIAEKYPDGFPDDNKYYYLTVENYGGIPKLKGHVRFSFNNNALYNVTILMNTDVEKLEMTGKEITDHFINNYNKLYGETIQTGLRTAWETAKSNVSIIYEEPMIMIEYQEVNYRE